MTAGPDHGDFRAVSASSTSAIHGVPSEGVVKYKAKRGLVPRGCSGLRSQPNPARGPMLDAAGLRVGRSGLSGRHLCRLSRAHARGTCGHGRGFRQRRSAQPIEIPKVCGDAIVPRVAKLPTVWGFWGAISGAFSRVSDAAEEPCNSRAASSKPLKRASCLLQFRPSGPICPP